MTNADELAYMPIAELAPRVEHREVSPVEIAQAILTRVQRLNPRLNAYYTVFGDELVAAARNAESEIVRAAYRGPLHGIPVGIKDIYEYDRTTCGSKPLENYRAEKQATAVIKLLESGALILGKTATYEFAFGFPTNKSYFKPTRNPWNLAYDAGGSSSGTASSVAAGLDYAGMGFMYRRFDPVAGAVLRHRRIETDLWTSQPCRRLPAGVEPRPYRSAGANRH